MKITIRAALAAWIAMGGGAMLMASDTWDGGAGDGLWSSGNNWVDNTAPVTGGGGVITFNHLGLGSNNTVDLDWTVSTLQYTNSNAFLAHTTTVAAAKTLVITNGDLRAGYSMNFALAVIQGGTVQIGNETAPADIFIGANATASAKSGTVVRIDSTLNLLNLRTLAVAKVFNLGGATATLDLSNGTIHSGSAQNTLKAAELNVGGGQNKNPIGTLRLPASLTAIDVGLWESAAGSGANKGFATLDFGSASQLRRLTVTNNFNLGKNGLVTLIGWPSDVTVRVGQAGAPVQMTVGTSEGETECGASLALTNGSFTAYLTSLKIGSNTNNGSAFSLLDLAGTAVQIGDEANKVKVNELNIGGGIGRKPNGTLRLPSNITEIITGNFLLGGGTTYGQIGSGTLDLGTGSQLQTFTASNGLYLGVGGSAFWVNWPSNVNVTVGLPGLPAPMVVMRTGGGALTARLVMTNGVFAGHLSFLEVGSNPSVSGYGSSGILDLRRATSVTMDIAGNALVGSAYNTDNTNTAGYVFLPAGTVTCSTNLYVGDAHSGSRGLLELNGTEFRVGQRVEIGATGIISNYVEGVSSGIDFQNADTNGFSIAAGGRLAVVFKAGPSVPGIPCWGLKMKGNVVEFMNSLTNDTSRFMLNTASLSAGERSRLGVFYQASGNFTYLGFQPASRGSVLMIR